MTKRIGIYVRVSTGEQTVENQKRELLRYAEARGFDIVKIYEDIASGATEKRPGLDLLMQDAKRRKFDGIAVWRFDRFGRSTQHLLASLQEFNDLGIDFISMSEGIDTSTSTGKLVFTFLGAVAEFERELIRERVVSGLARAKEAGVKLGRPRVGFDVNEALKLKLSGLSWSKLSKKVGVSSATLRRSLTPLLKNHHSSSEESSCSQPC